MGRQKAAGRTFGNPDILDAQPRGASAVSAKSAALVKSITDVLRSIPDHDGRSHAEIAECLNERGIFTGAGLPWTIIRVTTPLKKARLMLQAETAAAMRALPNFGMF